MAHCWDASLTETWAAGNVCQVLAWLLDPAAHLAGMLGVSLDACRAVDRGRCQSATVHHGARR